MSESLIQRISQNFPVSVTRRRLSHEECVGARSSMITLDACDVEEVLGQVLIDLVVSEKGGTEEDTRNIEELIRLLDIDNADAPVGGDELGYPVDSSCDEELLRLLKERQLDLFSKISREQAKIIADWLSEARTWPVLAWCREEVDAALDYWERRFKSGNP